MIRAVADTHVLIWYVMGSSNLSPTAKTAFDDAAGAGERIALSTMSLLEVVYLSERNRIDATAFDRILAILDQDDLLIEVAIDRAIAKSMRGIDRTKVPELPDRVIAATALSLGVPLITRDRRLQASGLATIW